MTWKNNTLESQKRESYYSKGDFPQIHDGKGGHGREEETNEKQTIWKQEWKVTQKDWEAFAVLQAIFSGIFSESIIKSLKLHSLRFLKVCVAANASEMIKQNWKTLLGIY